jgi:DNA polymerase II large subunit
MRPGRSRIPEDFDVNWNEVVQDVERYSEAVDEYGSKIQRYRNGQINEDEVLEAMEKVSETRADAELVRFVDLFDFLTGVPEDEDESKYEDTLASYWGDDLEKKQGEYFDYEQDRKDLDRQALKLGLDKNSTDFILSS